MKYTSSLTLITLMCTLNNIFFFLFFLKRNTISLELPLDYCFIALIVQLLLLFYFHDDTFDRRN